MELTYKVRGKDGSEYGPVASEVVTAWLREGRINSQSEVMRSDVDYWSPAASYTELQPALPAAGSTPPPASPLARPTPITTAPVAAETSDPVTEALMKSGGSWFYWIAGLSLVNSVVALCGSEWGFILGLGVTQIFDALGQSLGGAGKAVVLGLDAVAAGVFILFGVFARKRHTWAFVVGMVLMRWTD
ncbi:MAG: DUF4339 domain-containing protein [Verrucomicrobia bacterium]|nr:DUF4339 domain-containing protein [Verrucomicrobiota bacterium]